MARFYLRLARWAAPALLAAGLALSFGLAWLMQLGVKEHAGQNASVTTEQICREIGGDIAAYGTALRGLHGLFYSSGKLSRDEFRQYVRLLRLQHDASLLQHFDFMVREGDAFVVKHVEPLAGNEALLGVSTADFPPAREALTRLTAGDGLILSSPFRMERSSPGDTGLILLLPLYDSGDPARPYAATGRKPVGLVGATINLERTLRNIAEPLAQRHIYLKLTELKRAGDAGAPGGQPFYDSAGGAASAPRAWVTVSRELAVLGNRWRLDLTAEPASIPPVARYAPQIALVLALTLTLLLYLLVRTLGRIGMLATAQAEERTRELRQSEAQLNKAQAVARLGSWNLDFASGRLECSQEAYRLFGVAPGTPLTYDQFLERVHPEDRALVDGAWAAAPQGAPCGIEHRILGDGEARWVREQAELAFDAQGRAVSATGTVLDITERKRAEQQLRLAAKAFEHSLEGIIIADGDGNILSVNRAFSEITGYRPEEVIGRNPRLLQSGRHGADFYRAVWDSIRQRGHWHGEIWNRRKNGELFPELIGICAVPDHGGRPEHYIGMFTDISELKRSEETMRRFNVDLEQRVSERTAALTASNKELEAFSYSVSHDLRAPLRAIDGFALVLAEDYADKLDETALGHLARIRAASQRMAQIIDGMLELARIARVEPERREVDLSALATVVLGELPQDAGRRVEFVIAPNVHAFADPGLMHIVLQNLLHNAWKFTGRTRAARIEFGDIERDGERAFYVRDNGAGFEMEYMDKLFRPFQRLHRPDEFAGTGIGLATVRRIVARHGGRVWAEGAPGAGATFWFSLPAA